MKLIISFSYQEQPKILMSKITLLPSWNRPLPISHQITSPKLTLNLIDYFQSIRTKTIKNKVIIALPIIELPFYISKHTDFILYLLGAAYLTQPSANLHINDRISSNEVVTN